MKRLLLATTLLALLPAVVSAQEGREYRGGARAGNHEITLSGTGSNNNDFDAGSFGISASYGSFLTNAFELSLRQGFNWAGASNADDTWNAATHIAADYHFFPQSRFRPFIGVNIGYLYGDAVRDTGIGGPEIGFKYFVNDTTFVLLQSEYQFFFRSSHDVTNNFDDGAFVHTIGLGFVF
jgi:hypothetical protein